MANGSYSAGNLNLEIDAVANNTIKYLDAVIDRLNIINGGLGKTTKTSKLNNINLGGSKTLKSLFKIGSLTAVFHIFRRVGNVMGDILDKGGDFGETLNLWKVAMGNEFLPQATEFVNKLNQAYGISKETLMNSQAIFKNMIGSLGQISDETAYQLSEGITQMALDYASLYNVNFEDAMTKFQAALAGQVRPIRSVSGYDITENTLYQLYQTLGGEKTMRQLSRTEKQLLAIYAVFNQMDSSGAVGDLDRTINSFANQSRVTSESFKEVVTYAGLVATRLIENSKIMQYLNAGLIFMSSILEGLATSLDTGLGESGDVFGDMENSVNGATNAVENLQSALLDFDKFRALDQSKGDNVLGIDQTIVDALSRYDTILDKASLEAQEIANAWLKSLGFVDKNNDGVLDLNTNIDNIFNKINSIKWEGISENLTTSITDALYGIGDWIKNLPWEKWGTDVSDFINGADWGNLIIGALNLADKLAEAISDFVVAILTGTDWVALFKKIVMMPLEYVLIELGIIDMAKDMFKFAEGTKFYDWMFGNSFFQGYANGGLPDKGSVFVAGEAGAEMVYNMPSGQSGVANVQQIAQATYSGTMRALSDWWGGSGAKGDIPQLKEANATGIYQAVTGVAKAQGKVWANV